MLDPSLYFATLKGRGLTFEESVYAIAFGLEEEIQQKGKEAVFSELPCRERMPENIKLTLGEDRWKALRWAFGYSIDEEAFQSPSWRVY